MVYDDRKEHFRHAVEYQAAAKHLSKHIRFYVDTCIENDPLSAHYVVHLQNVVRNYYALARNHFNAGLTWPVIS